MFLFSLQNVFKKNLVSVHKVCERRTCRVGAPSAWFAVPEVVGERGLHRARSLPILSSAWLSGRVSAALNRKW